jgi:hypothetical protein
VLKRGETFYRSWWSKVALVGAVIVVLSYLIGFVLSVHRHWYHAYADGFWGATFVLVLLAIRMRRRSQRLTIAANGWQMSESK